MKYSELTRRYFETTPAVGKIEAAGTAPGNFRGSAGRRERGTWVQFDIHAEAGRILEARFLVFGCPHTIAAASWVAEHAAGSAIRAVLPEPVEALRERFDVPQEKLGRLLIVEDAWLAVMKSAIDSMA